MLRMKIQLDANAKIGMENLNNDPNNISANGKILIDVVERQKLVIANTLEVCKGVVTRERITKNTVERSVIDYVILCERMEEYLEEIMIDDDRTHVLTSMPDLMVGKRM